MAYKIKETDINKFIVVGDRVLIRPVTQSEQTDSGLFLPPGVQEKEKIHSGYIIKAGPGYAIPSLEDKEEFWKEGSKEAKYVPLQAREGDLAIYLQKSAYELKFKEAKYVIVPHSAILLLIRDEDLFN